MDKKELKKLKTEQLRELAKERGVEETLERAELIEALAVSEEPGEPSQEQETESKEESGFLKEGAVSEVKRPSKGSKADLMKKKLMAQPRVTIMIPIGAKEPRGITESVILNGYRLNITKGVYVKVPQQVAEIVMRSQQMTNEAIDNYFLMDEQGLSPAMRDKLK